jgi:uncharacterized membrane protein SirB2
MLYVTMKQLHIACVVLSITGFCLRGILLAKKSALMERRWMRLLPHANDAILLAAALTLAVLIGQYPFIDDWLTAKVLGLLAYIVLGAVALRAARNPRARILAGLYGFAAVGIFGWIVSIAVSKHPWGFLA